jgi:drug/metabolite transporter (DMT)-like permease
MTRPPRLPPYAMLVVACALWGAATVLAKALLESIAPVTLLVLQLVPSATVLWVAVLISGARLPVRAALPPLLLLGLLNPGLSYTLSLIGLASIPASVATLLWAAEPLMILGLAALVLREPVTLQLLMVMATGFVGVALVAGVGAGFAIGAGSPAGIVLLLLAVACCAIYTVFSRKLSDSADPLAIVAVQQAAASVWAIALLAAHTPYGAPSDILSLDPFVLAAAVASGLMYYAAAYWLYISALRFVPAAVAGTYFNIIPIFGVLLAVVFLGERLGLGQWVGAATILLSAILLVRLTKGADEARGGG